MGCGGGISIGYIWASASCDIRDPYNNICQIEEFLNSEQDRLRLHEMGHFLEMVLTVLDVGLYGNLLCFEPMFKSGMNCQWIE